MVYVESAVRGRQIIAAARDVLVRDGVARTTMRAVADEAQIPLGTLQHVFPTKQKLLRAVIEDVVEEIAEVLRTSADLDDGLEHAVRQGVRGFWNTLVVGRNNLQLVQFELVVQALRTPGLEDLARWQYERYVDVVAHWCEQAAARAHETVAIGYRSIARTFLAGIDGLIVQYVVDPDPARADEDLDTLITMILGAAAVRPVSAD
ncbi:TetR/AcrR family transcriptional regulator [Mycolicibacterium mucogenicum]|uniref:TetR/AcrR family transcriptional regulator n=1 Tax=Mycolicibacterium mucogenicum DSM 44124 TaxID=1226753 RepID=A0A8H2JGR1_MYCMU|nr:TetR/AcrR family transcriptional regulator [Mycolicibacterium mucogenicum]KAB7760862.1 TetR family transcriptional regulator [Mycolicibacterium mucogenicum DSM 44124]QPG69356.1 TetR/AcrR family transcriptional regulator [Mycolicibacterium mucogenicum DSM 44124]